MAIGLAANAISSASASLLHPQFKSATTLLLSSSSNSIEGSSCHATVRSWRSLSSRMPTIRSAATKPVKSPAEKDRKTKREVLLQKKVRSVDAKEALRLQQENKFVILDVSKT